VEIGFGKAERGFSKAGRDLAKAEIGLGKPEIAFGKAGRDFVVKNSGSSSAFCGGVLCYARS
jgi:hypothetical protein